MKDDQVGSAPVSANSGIAGPMSPAKKDKSLNVEAHPTTGSVMEAKQRVWQWMRADSDFDIQMQYEKQRQDLDALIAAVLTEARKRARFAWGECGRGCEAEYILKAITPETPESEGQGEIETLKAELEVTHDQLAKFMGTYNEQAERITALERENAELRGKIAERSSADNT